MRSSFSVTNLFLFSVKAERSVPLVVFSFGISPTGDAFLGVTLSLVVALTSECIVSELDTSKERYSLTWNGKSKARQIAQEVSTGTLRPAKEESKNWDNTENIYIEGDNLEVLKLLQKSYHGKIKMIYIDPPYNTGKDFVYKDNFKDNIENYKKVTGQVSEEGTKLTTNTDTDGRYHSNWLNMMYPRLKLARNLLTDDGVIFISIDDNEQANLKKICDEIFGEENFVADFLKQKKHIFIFLKKTFFAQVYKTNILKKKIE